MSDNDMTRLSKSLSYILRHGGIKENLPIRSDGFLPVSELQKNHKFKNLSLSTLKELVLLNDKQRFTLQVIDGSYMIRANQGHSINVDVDMEKIIDPTGITCVHGTYNNVLPNISKYLINIGETWSMSNG